MDPVQQAVDEAAVNNTQLMGLTPFNCSANGISGASVKMEADPVTGSATDNGGQPLLHVCIEVNTSNVEKGEEATIENIQSVPNGGSSDSFNTNIEDVHMESSAINCDSAQPGSSDIDYDAAQPQFVCTDYDAHSEQEEAIDEDFSQYSSEASAVLKAITLARRDLEGEIQRKVIKIREQQSELDRLTRELKEVKQLERNEMKKLKPVDARPTSGAGNGARPISYTPMRGKRFNSVLYAAQSGHIYTSKGNLYFKCCLRVHKGVYCPGLAKIAFEGYLVERREHNHTISHPDLLRRRLVNQVRNAVRDDETGRSVREIFDEVVSKSPHASLLHLKSIVNTLRNDRRRKDERPLEKVFRRSLTKGSSSRSLRTYRMSKRRRVDSDESDDSDVAEGGASVDTRSQAAEGDSTGSSAGQPTIPETSAVEPSPVTEEVPSPAAPPRPGPPAPAPAVQEAAEAAVAAAPAPAVQEAVEAAAAAPAVRDTAAAAAAAAPSKPSCARMLGVAAPEFRRQLAFMLKDSNNRDLVIAFTAPRVTTAARKSSTGYTIQLDSSFKLCPPVGGVFGQLLLVSLSVGRQQRPGFLVLLRDAGRPVLTEVLRMVRRRLGDTQPDQVVCASEPTLLAAAADGWPAAAISCSVSQFCRDLLAKVIVEDLSAQFSSRVPVRSWLTMLLAVPFLPPPRMAGALEKLDSLIPKEVNERTRQCLRRLNVHVTEEWLRKFGAVKLSAFGRPPVDELDTIQFMRGLHGQYRELRSAAGFTAASRGPEPDFWPFVLAVNEMLQSADGALDRDEPGPLCWPNFRVLELLVAQQAANLYSEQTSAVSFLKTVGAQLVAQGLPPGTGIRDGDGAASNGGRPDSGDAGDAEPAASSELSGRTAGGSRGGWPSGRGAGASVLSQVRAIRIASAAATERAILAQKTSVTGGSRGATGRVGSTPSVGDATVGPGSWSVLKEVRIELERIRGHHRPPRRRSGRPRAGPAVGTYCQEPEDSESDPPWLPEDA